MLPRARVGIALFGTLMAGHLVAGLHLSAVVAAAGFVMAAALSARFVRPPVATWPQGRR